MPYMPTHFYPKNEAIQFSKENGSLRFTANIDVYDTINEVELYIYPYGKDEFTYKFKLTTENDTTVLKLWNGENWADGSSYLVSHEYNLLPLDGGSGDNQKFVLSLVGLKLEEKKYTWKAKFIGTKYDRWVLDGRIQEVDTEGNSEIIKIFPSLGVEEGQQIVDITDEGHNFTVVHGYFDQSTTASNIASSANTSIITLTDALDPVTQDTVDLKITVDVTTYDVASVSVDGKTVTINSTITLASPNVFGQYINVYRRYMSLAINHDKEVVKQGEGIENEESQEYAYFAKDELFTIYDNSITSNDNYFTLLKDVELSIFDTFDGESVVNKFTGEYSGAMDWYQWKLYRNNILVEDTDKIYSNKPVYQYNYFHADNEEGTDYRLELIVHDKSNCTIVTDKIFKSTYQRGGANSKLRCKWNVDKKAIEVSFKEFVQITADFYKGNKKIDAGKAEGEVFDWISDNQSMRVHTGYSVGYNQVEGAKLAFDKASSMIIKLKLDKDFRGDVFKVGNKTFSIAAALVDGSGTEFSGGETYNFGGGSANIYNEASNELFNSGEGNVSVDTQFYLDETKTYVIDGNNIFFYYNDILVEDWWYVIITQPSNSTKGKVTVSSDVMGYTPKTFDFDVFNEPIDNITLYGGAEYQFAQVIDSSSNVLENLRNSVETWDGSNNNPAAAHNPQWSSGTLFLTDYQNTNINVSNIIAIPTGAVASTIYVYKRCALLDKYSDIKEIIEIGGFDNTFIGFYDYSVANDHDYTYYIIQTYTETENDNTVLRALPEIVSQTIEPDYYEVDIIGTKSQLDKNIYEADPEELWYFELDAKADTINFTSENNVYTSGKFARVNKTDVEYMTGSATMKLGSLKNEFEYVDDNRHYLEKFKKFAKTVGVKGLRLKNGMVIPVDIQIKSATNQSHVVGNPTDIAFDWWQVGDAEKFVLIELFKKEDSE